jgi:hypothetical protein
VVPTPCHINQKKYLLTKIWYDQLFPYLYTMNPYVALKESEVEDIVPALTGTETRLWIYLLSKAGADNCVYLHTSMRLDICRALGFNQNTLSSAIRGLVQKNVTVKQSRYIVKILKGETAVTIYTGLHAEQPDIRKLPDIKSGPPPPAAGQVLPGEAKEEA